MTEPRGFALAYTVTHEARYWPAIRQHHRGRREVIASGHRGDDLLFEVILEERADLTAGGPASRRHREPPALHLKMFDDSWRAFTLVPELFAALGAEDPDDRPQTIDQFIDLLDVLGAIDQTEREPYPEVVVEVSPQCGHVDPDHGRCQLAEGHETGTGPEFNFGGVKDGHIYPGVHR